MIVLSDLQFWSCENKSDILLDWIEWNLITSNTSLASKLFQSEIHGGKAKAWWISIYCLVNRLNEAINLIWLTLLVSYPKSTVLFIARGAIKISKGNRINVRYSQNQSNHIQFDGFARSSTEMGKSVSLFFGCQPCFCVWLHWGLKKKSKPKRQLFSFDILCIVLFIRKLPNIYETLYLLVHPLRAHSSFLSEFYCCCCWWCWCVSSLDFNAHFCHSTRDNAHACQSLSLHTIMWFVFSPLSKWTTSINVDYYIVSDALSILFVEKLDSLTMKTTTMEMAFFVVLFFFCFLACHTRDDDDDVCAHLCFCW